MDASAPTFDSARAVRRVVVPRFGDVGVLEVRSGPPAPLAPGAVRVRVQAAGVNFADLMMRMGLYPEAPPRPFSPGYEVSGTVSEVSAEAAAAHPGLAPGQRVIAVTRFGGYAEDVVVPAGKVFPLPDTWSFEDGAAFPVVFLTAWIGLRGMARVRAGDRVLIQGIAGGVGLAALQVARAAGARVIGTCGGDRKVKAVEAMGAERAIDYRTEHVGAVVRAWAPDGVDIVLESRGGKGLRESLKFLRPTGRVVSFGVSELVTGRTRNWFRAAPAVLRLLFFNLLDLVNENRGVFGENVLRLWDDDALLSEATADLFTGAVSGALRPVVDRAFPLERAGEAHAYLHDRKNIGKVVLTTGA